MLNGTPLADCIPALQQATNLLHCKLVHQEKPPGGNSPDSGEVSAPGLEPGQILGNLVKFRRFPGSFHRDSKVRSTYVVQWQKLE
jgi:hypothetical protein